VRVVSVFLFLVATVPDLRAGEQVPGDCNQDGGLDLSDSICLLGFLFLGGPSALPCGNGQGNDLANVTLFDSNGDDRVDLSDAVYVLGFLFSGDNPPVQGTQCIDIPECSQADACSVSVTYSDMVPVFEKKCAPCHLGDTPGTCSGQACFGSIYEDSVKPTLFCDGGTVAECGLERVLEGSMPIGSCTGDPTKDAGNQRCLTQEELDQLTAWVNAGSPE